LDSLILFGWLSDHIGRKKIILISKVAIAAGGILILAIIIGAVGFGPQRA